MKPPIASESTLKKRKKRLLWEERTCSNPRKRKIETEFFLVGKPNRKTTSNLQKSNNLDKAVGEGRQKPDTQTQ